MEVTFCCHQKFNYKSKPDHDYEISLPIRGLKSIGSFQTLSRKNLKTSKKRMRKDLFYQSHKKKSKLKALSRKNLKTSEKTMRESLFNQCHKKSSKLKALSRRNPRPSKKSMRKHTSMQSLWTSRKNIRKTLCIQNMWASRRVSLQESSQKVTISILQWQRQLMIQRGSWSVQAHLDPLSMGQLQLFLPPFYSFPRAFRHNLPRNQDWCRPQILLPPLFQEVFQNPFQSLPLLPSDILKNQLNVQSVPTGQSTKTSRSI